MPISMPVRGMPPAESILSRMPRTVEGYGPARLEGGGSRAMMVSTLHTP